ncbi:MAG TPA: hypothetical protein VFS17_07800, partial [Methylophilaceae bacterium]|nr:hypothetical protein [Methylophilaceae bacterium]
MDNSFSLNQAAVSRGQLIPPIPPEIATPAEAVPLCVDLDGTLIKTDLLLESFLALVKANPIN